MVHKQKSIEIGNYIPQNISDTGRDWAVSGITKYRVRTDICSPAVLIFGMDTEGGGRAKTNLLKEPVTLLIRLKDGSQFHSSEVRLDKCGKKVIKQNSIEYRFSPFQTGLTIIWRIKIVDEKIQMEVCAESNVSLMTQHDADLKAESVEQILLKIPFAPEAMGTNIIAEHWGQKGEVKMPYLINCLDMGQLMVQTKDGAERRSWFVGSRAIKRTDLYIEVVGENCNFGTQLEFTPVYLQKPSEQIPSEEWKKVRRGLLSLVQCTPYYRKACGWNGSPGGIIGNNVISDPVSCSLGHNLRWIAAMGIYTVVGGVDLKNVLKYQIEYWLNYEMNEEGSINYVLENGNISADSNTGILNLIGDYFCFSKDKEFVIKNKERILRAVNYFVSRELENDGLFISFRDGNGNYQFGDTGYDTIASGYKNAFVNAQVYKAYQDVSTMMEAIDEWELSKFYNHKAVKLRKSFNRQFFDTNSGLYYWWIGKNGVKHQYIFTHLQSIAVLNGLADYLKEDTGIEKDGKDIMNTMWNLLQKAHYYDEEKNKEVYYIDKENEKSGFYWGIPGNLLPVPEEFNYGDFGKIAFPFYCNGGIFPSDTTYTIEALKRVGMDQEARAIKDKIYQRYHEGILENGSGFWKGVINVLGTGYSIMKWDGIPTDYEGIISRDYSFLENTLWEDLELFKVFLRTKQEDLA